MTRASTRSAGSSAQRRVAPGDSATVGPALTRTRSRAPDANQRLAGLAGIVGRRELDLDGELVWLLLVGERGWSPARFERWLADSLCAQLLPPPG